MQSESNNGVSLPKTRIEAIDYLRGFVMVVMALDHVRYYFHEFSHISPTDIDTTTPILFFTRWITHTCAPGFVFLAGVSAFISSKRKTGAEFSTFLIKRGLWLIFLDMAVVRYGSGLSSEYTLTGLQVFWTI